ncbi:MAG: hypothetical protein LBK68_00770 [Candidatus Margulisbacteria bacterium]|jgi:hypothetical protein|nr:hypothetical protein [Candidatus Margulisiibacteriota bacterium]
MYQYLLKVISDRVGPPDRREIANSNVPNANNAETGLVDAYGRELDARSPATVRLRLADGTIVDAAVLDYVYAGQQVKLLTDGAGRPLFIAKPTGYDVHGNIEYEFMEVVRDAAGAIHGQRIKRILLLNADGSIYRTIKEEKIILNDSDLSRVVVIGTNTAARQASENERNGFAEDGTEFNVSELSKEIGTTFNLRVYKDGAAGEAPSVYTRIIKFGNSSVENLAVFDKNGLLYVVMPGKAAETWELHSARFKDEVQNMVIIGAEVTGSSQVSFAGAVVGAEAAQIMPKNNAAAATISDNHIEPSGLTTTLTQAGEYFRDNYKGHLAITQSRNPAHAFRKEIGKEGGDYDIDIYPIVERLYEKSATNKELLTVIEAMNKSEKKKLLHWLEKRAKELEKKVEETELLGGIKRYPLRATADILMQLFLRTLAPEAGVGSEALLGAINQMVYSYFGGSMNYFFKSMMDYSKETHYADKSGGSSFVLAMHGNPELGRFLGTIPKEYTREYVNTEDAAGRYGDTGIVLKKQGDGSIDFRFSYATSLQDAREFGVYINGLIARAERELADLKTRNSEYSAKEQEIFARREAELEKLKESYGKDAHGRDIGYLARAEKLLDNFDKELEALTAEYKDIVAAQELLGSLYSIRYAADRRFSLSDAGRRDRGWAGIWYFQLDKKKPLTLPKEIQDHKGVYIHEKNNILQVNYFLTRAELDEYLVPALKNAGYSNDFIEKVRIGFKIVESAYYAEIANRGPFTELPADQRQRQVTEVAAFTSVIYDLPIEHLYISFMQEEYSLHKVTLAIQANSPEETHSANAYGNAAHARERETRANAVNDTIMTRYSKGRLVHLLEELMSEISKKHIEIGSNLDNILESIVYMFDASKTQSQAERLLAVKEIVLNFLSGNLDTKEKRIATLQAAIQMDDFVSADAQRNELLSHNYRLLGLILADQHGRRIPWNMILDEVLQDPRIFPADDRERSIMTVGFQKLNMFQNENAGKRGAVPYKHRGIVINDLNGYDPETEFPLRQALREVLAEELKKGLILEAQIDNTVNLLITATEWQEKSVPRIAEIMSGFWTNGQLSIAEQDELRGLLLQYFAVDADEMQRIINDLIANKEAIRNREQLYLDTDIGSNHINQINAENLGLKAYLGVYGYARGYNIYTKGSSRPNISEALAAKPKGEKFSEKEIKELFGAAFMDYMSGRTGSDGGINEVTRWIESEHLLLGFSDLRRQNGMQKARESRIIDPTFGKLRRRLGLSDIDNQLYFPESHGELYQELTHVKETQKIHNNGTMASLSKDSLDHIVRNYDTIGYEIMSAVAEYEDTASIDATIEKLKAAGFNVVDLKNIEPETDKDKQECIYDLDKRTITVTPNVEELRKTIIRELDGDSHKIVSYKNGMFTIEFDEGTEGMALWLADSLEAKGYTARANTRWVTVESNINLITDILGAEGEKVKYNRELTFVTNSRDFIKLILDEKLSQDEAKVLVTIFNSHAEYVSDFKGEEERKMNYLSEALRRKVVEVLKDPHVGLYASLDDMEKWINDKSKENLWFAGQTHREQVRAFWRDRRAKLKIKLNEAIKEFAGDHKADIEGFTSINADTLTDRYMEVIEDAQNLLQATADGMLLEINRAVDNYKVIVGQNILAPVSAAAGQNLTVQQILLNMQIDGANSSRAELDAVSSGIDWMGTNDKKIVDALKFLLSVPKNVNKPNQSGAVDPKNIQLSFAQLANGRKLDKENPVGYLAGALKLAAAHQPGQKYVRSKHWNIFVSDLLSSISVNGGREAKNYTGAEATIKTVAELAEHDEVKKILELLKGLSENEIQSLIDQTVAWLEAEARYKASLEPILEGKGMSRDTATVLTDMLFAQDTEDGYRGELSVKANAIEFVDTYHKDSYPKGAHTTGEYEMPDGTKGNGLILNNGILRDYIKARIDAQSAPKRAELDSWKREQESMFNIIRISPKYDSTFKPETFNGSYIGLTPFETMQKIIKGMFLHYYQWNGQYTIQQVWANFKDEMQRDTISNAMPTILYRGVEYPFWDLLDKVFAEIDKKKLLSLHSFKANGKENYDYALDAMRQRYKKVDEIFDDVMLKVISNFKSYVEVTQPYLDELAIDPEMQALNRENQKELDMLSTLLPTLLFVANAGLTMDEIEDALVSENADKDNLFNKYNSLPVLSAYRPDEQGNIVNWTTVLLQAQQAMYYSMWNKNQRGGWYDMLDFNRTKSYVDEMMGFLQNQGCFNKNLRVHATYLHLLRGVINVAVPVDNSIMDNGLPNTVGNNPNPPSYVPRMSTELGVPAAAAALSSVVMPLLGPVLSPLLLNILTSVLYLNVVPGVQRKMQETYRRVSVLKEEKEDDNFLLRLEKLHQVLDLSKTYSAVEDYRITLEMMKSFLWGRQIRSFIGSAKAESDHDVTALVQFPRWFGAILELSPAELMDAKFMERFAKEHHMPKWIMREIVKFREEASFHDLHPMSMYYNLRFSMVMSMYALFGFSPFSFAGPLSAVAGSALLIGAVGIFALFDYMFIKNQIAAHHWTAAGINRANERVAEDRSNTINGILIPKIESTLVSVYKMKFISSQPVYIPEKRYADGLYFGKADALKMQIAAKLQYRQKLADLATMKEQAEKNITALVNQIAGPELARYEKELRQDKHWQNKSEAEITQEAKQRAYKDILNLARGDAGIQISLRSGLELNKKQKEGMLRKINTLSQAADSTEEQKMALLDNLIDIAKLDDVIVRTEATIASSRGGIGNPLGALRARRPGVRLNNWHNMVRKYMPAVSMSALSASALLTIASNPMSAILLVPVLVFGWFSTRNLFLRPKNYVERGIGGAVPSLREAQLYAERYFDGQGTHNTANGGGDHE